MHFRLVQALPTRYVSATFAAALSLLLLCCCAVLLLCFCCFYCVSLLLCCCCCCVVVVVVVVVVVLFVLQVMHTEKSFQRLAVQVHIKLTFRNLFFFINVNLTHASADQSGVLRDNRINSISAPGTPFPR